MTVQTKPSEPPSELEQLKQTAKLLGVTHSNNIGIDTLKGMIAEALKLPTPKAPEPVAPVERELTPQEEKAKARRDATALVRCKISMMNPYKKGVKADTYTVSNDWIGKVSRVIPYEPKWYKNGFHVERILLDHLESRVYNHYQTDDYDRPSCTEEKEFVIVELPPLTREELNKLAAAQLAGNHFD